MLRDTRIHVVIDGILDAAKAETAVKYGTTVFFVALAEARVLVQLREYLVQCRDRVIVLQALQLLLDRLRLQHLLLGLLRHLGAHLTVAAGAVASVRPLLDQLPLQRLTRQQVWMQALVVATATRAGTGGQALHAELTEWHERAWLPQVATAARQRHPTAVWR